MPLSSNIVSSSNKNDQTLYRNDFILETEPTMTPESNRSSTTNLLAKELQSALKPMNIMQEVFFCAKYKIRDNIITTNSVFYNIVSVSAFFIVSLGCYYFTYASVSSYDARGFQYCRELIKVYTFLTLSLGSLLNCCISTIQSFSNALFVMRIQAIYTHLEIINCLKSMVLPSWACVLGLLIHQIVWSIFSCCVIHFMGLKWGLVFTSYVWLSFDIHILYATRILQLLTNSLKSWVENVKMPENENLDKDCYWRTMFKVYMEILEAYKLFGKTFHHLILFNIAVLASKTLICIWVRIETKKVTTASDAYFAFLSFISLAWIIKNMLLLIMLSVESEKFFSTLREVQSTCTQLTYSSSSITQKRVCKNIQRVQKTSFKKMHLCGLFIMDAALSLRLCAFITTYTIVIVQFELL